MSYSFYPRKNDACPSVDHCPHAGGVAIASLVLVGNQNEEYQRYLHGTIKSERERCTELFQENRRLQTALDQVKLELKLERQNKFATNQQKQAQPEGSAVEQESADAPSKNPPMHRARSVAHRLATLVGFAQRRPSMTGKSTFPPRGLVHTAKGR